MIAQPQTITAAIERTRQYIAEVESGPVRGPGPWGEGCYADLVPQNRAEYLEREVRHLTALLGCLNRARTASQAV